VLTNGEIGDFFVNVLPGVRMDAKLTQIQELDFTISGRFLLELFGKSLADWSSPSSSFSLFKDGQGFAIDDEEWISRSVWSTAMRCLTDVVCISASDDFEFDQARLNNKKGTITYRPGARGDFQPTPGFTDLPPMEKVCVGGICYEADDPALPIDRFDPAGGAVPEPATWAMMIVGFGMIGRRLRRRQIRMSGTITV
jgi:PEP-CTERM motif